MDIDVLINRIDGIAVNSGCLAEFDMFETMQKFFSREDIADILLDLNRDRLYLQSTTHDYKLLPPYADKTRRHKIKVHLPSYNYTYYETGATHESLELFAGDEYAQIVLGEDAPEYAYDLIPSAWGVTEEEFEEVEEPMREYVLSQLKEYING